MADDAAAGAQDRATRGPAWRIGCATLAFVLAIVLCCGTDPWGAWTGVRRGASDDVVAPAPPPPEAP